MTAWNLLPPADPDTLRTLSESLNQSALICELLARRGVVDYETAHRFFRSGRYPLHDPFEMQGMKAAVERLAAAVRSRETIMVFGDYDVDGVCSVAILADFLETRGVKTVCYIPNRFTHGYGLNSDGIRQAREQNVSLIVTVDCGITGHEHALEAAASGMDLIICDHHLPGETLPEALAVLNPKQAACSYPYDELSGAGVVFKLVQALAASLPPDPGSAGSSPAEISAELESCLDLVALSIAADVVPVTGENRTLMSMGLDRLNHSPRPGIAALMKEAKIEPGSLRSGDIAFSLAPRLNATGRMGDATLSLDLLRAVDRTDVSGLVRQIETINQNRRDMDAKVLAKAVERIESTDAGRRRNAIVLYEPGWHEGVLGLVASRLVDRYAKPVVLLTASGTEAMAKGSGRSIEGFDLHEALQACSHLLDRFGGHAAAAGLTLHVDRVERLAEEIDRFAGEWWSRHGKPEPTLHAEADIPLQRITDRFWKILGQFEPHGPENPVPVFISRNVTLRKEPMLLKGAHLKLWLNHGAREVEAIGFGMSAHFESVMDVFRQGGARRGMDIAYQIQENTFRGRSTLQLLLLDLKVGISG